MRILIVFLLLVYSLNICGQSNPMRSSDSISISKEQLSQTIDMLKSLNTKGIDMSEDSVIVSDEFNKLLNDETYRRGIILIYML